MSKPQPQPQVQSGDLEAGFGAADATATISAPPPPQPQIPRDLEAGFGAADTTATISTPPVAAAAMATATKAPTAAVRKTKNNKKKKVVADEEDPRLRWAFVRKVYCILALQFAFTAGLAAAACFVPTVPRFFKEGRPFAVFWPVFITILVAPAIVMWPMLKYRERHPVNLVLLGIFTVCCSASIAVSASSIIGIVLLQTTILTATTVIGLTIFTFWAARRGWDFSFLFPFLFTSLLTLLMFSLIQFFFPLGRIMVTIYGFIVTFVFSGFIIFDTHMLLKRHAYNEYIVAAISLYLDVINLFMGQLLVSSV